MTVRLRFVDTNNDWASRIIRGAQLGLTPYSHVECVTPDGFFLGSLMAGGVQKRAPPYDTTYTQDLFVDLPATDAQTAAFYAFAESKMGCGYDEDAIGMLAIGAAIGEFPDWTASGVYVCSALMTACMLNAGLIQSSPLSGGVRGATPLLVLGQAAVTATIGRPTLRGVGTKAGSH